jgi:hypothetical protein
MSEASLDMATDNPPDSRRLQALPPLVLLEIQVSTLFRCDAFGRLMSLNELASPVAPRFFLGRTQAGNILRLRDDLPYDLVKELEMLVEREPLPYDLQDPPREQFAITHALRRHNAVIDVHRGPAYAFLGPIPTVSGILPLGPAQAAHLHPALATLAPELASRQPCFAAVEDGVAVSVCYSARIGAQAAEAGVQTVEAYRGRGHASRVTAAWAAAVRAQRLLPLYSTTWENVASQAVARHLGLEVYAEDWHIG